MGQTPKLLETFDQLIRSSEIRSTDPVSWLGHLGILKLYEKDLSYSLFCFFCIIDEVIIQRVCHFDFVELSEGQILLNTFNLKN